MLLALVAASNISLSLALLVGNHRAVVVVPAVPPSPRWVGDWAASSGIVPTAATTAATFASPSSRGIARSRGGTGGYPAPSSSFFALSSSAAASSSSASSSSSSAAAAAADDVARRTAFATAGLVSLDVGFRSLFAKYSIPFPSSLAGCGALFAAMVSLNAIAVAGDDVDDDDDDGKKRMGEGLYLALNPGATLLAKWLPVFFVPSLITLPLASGLGNAREVRIRAPRSVS